MSEIDLVSERAYLESAVVTAALAEWRARRRFHHSNRAVRLPDILALGRAGRDREEWELAQGELWRACSDLDAFLGKEEGTT